MIIVYVIRGGFRVVDSANSGVVTEGPLCKEYTRRSVYPTIDAAFEAEKDAGIREALFRLDRERLAGYLAKPEKAAVRASIAAKRARARHARLKEKGHGWREDFVINPDKQQKG